MKGLLVQKGRGKKLGKGRGGGKKKEGKGGQKKGREDNPTCLV